MHYHITMHPAAQAAKRSAKMSSAGAHNSFVQRGLQNQKEMIVSWTYFKW